MSIPSTCWTYPAVRNWDGGFIECHASAGSESPATPSNINSSRYIFTTLTGTNIVSFDITNVGATNTDTTKLWHVLDPTDVMAGTCRGADQLGDRGRGLTLLRLILLGQ